MNIIKTYSPALAALFLPALAFAAPQTWSELVALFVLIINVATPMLVALALVLFLVRILATTVSGADKGHGFPADRFRTVAMWGIGIMFVMVSIWGILNLLENTFLRTGGGGFSTGSPSEAECTELGGEGC